MKLLLIGKNGQVGSEIHQQALSRGYEVRAFGREELDITDYAAVKQALREFQPNVVVNASAFHVVPECENFPEKAFAVNAAAIKNLAESCVELDSWFVHYSTDKVFDGFREKPYEETDTPRPLQIYGISKLAGEYVALSYNPKTLIIRTCGVYGGPTGSKSKGGNFVLYILKQAQEQKRLEISSDQKASFAYAMDLAEGTLMLLEKKADAGIYHLVNEGYASWAEFAQEIIKLSGKNLEIIPIDRKGTFKNVKTPQFTVLANTKAKALAVILPDWQDALRRYVQFLEEKL